MSVLEHINAIKIKCEIRGASKLTEELPCHAMLWIEVRVITIDDEKEIGVDLDRLRMALESSEIEERLQKIIKIIDNSKKRIHQIFLEKYAENNELWVNFIREIEKESGYSFMLMKVFIEYGKLDLIEERVNYNFDKILSLLEKNAKELTE
jgi:hypothetical protein